MMEITNRDAEAVVAEIIQSMIDALQEGNEIEIRGFGSFRLRSRRARRGRNPKTGESVDVPAKRVVYFKMGKDLKHFLTQNA
jgi:integration host factor subunit beta